MIDVVIFSKNRPLQLYSLLESMYALTDADGSANVTVIHKYDESYSSALNELCFKFEKVKFMAQSDFKKDTLMSLFSSLNRFCVFLVDDIVFKRGISFNDITHLLNNNPSILTFSLRMGLHLNFCYPTSTIQPIPDGNITSELFVWDWTKSQGDWNYPVSLDGHVFRKQDILTWSSRITFDNPNQFEDYLQRSFKVDNTSTHCVCSTESVIINIPINRVQNEYKNRCEEIDPAKLLDIWNDGKKIDFKMLCNVTNTSAHFPITSLPVTERN